MKKRLFITFGICTFLMAQTAFPVYAAYSPTVPARVTVSGNTIAPRMRYTARASTNLIIDSKGEATITASITGYKNITSKVSLSAELQQYKNGKWSKVTSFSDSDDSHKLNLYETYSVSKGYKYRVRLTSKAVHNGKSETRTVTSSSVTY